MESQIWPVRVNTMVNGRWEAPGPARLRSTVRIDARGVTESRAVRIDSGADVGTAVRVHRAAAVGVDARALIGEQRGRCEKRCEEKKPQNPHALTMQSRGRAGQWRSRVRARPKHKGPRSLAALNQVRLERETGLEPATSTLARLHSTN